MTSPAKACAEKYGLVPVRCTGADEQTIKKLKHRAITAKKPLHLSNGEILTEYLKDRGLI